MYIGRRIYMAFRLITIHLVDNILMATGQGYQTCVRLGRT